MSGNLSQRLRRLDTAFAAVVRRNAKSTVDDLEAPALSPEDQAWFEAMIARSLAGDRDWPSADWAKYHDMLLGDYEGGADGSAA